jgi:hypothetical protein
LNCGKHPDEIVAYSKQKHPSVASEEDHHHAIGLSTFNYKLFLCYFCCKNLDFRILHEKAKVGLEFVK